MPGIIICLLAIIAIFAASIHMMFGFWIMAIFVAMVYLFMGALLATSIPPHVTPWIKIKMLFLWLPGYLSDRVFRIIES
jgi:hypothetical protein